VYRRPVSRLLLPEAVRRHVREHYPRLLITSVDFWYGGAKVVIGRGNSFWPIKVGMRMRRVPRSREELQDVLYDRLVRAIRARVRKLGWIPK